MVIEGMMRIDMKIEIMNVMVFRWIGIGMRVKSYRISSLSLNNIIYSYIFKIWCMNFMMMI